MEEGRQQNAGYLNASAAAERLQRNVNREHFLCTDFLLAFWQVTHPRHAAQSCCPAALPGGRLSFPHYSSPTRHCTDLHSRAPRAAVAWSLCIEL